MAVTLLVLRVATAR